MNTCPADISNTDEQCAQMLRILSDPTRLAVVRMLLDRPQRVGELNTVLEMDQSLLSHHLRVMRDAGLVKADREGKAMRYRLAPHLKVRRSGDGIDLNCCVLTFRREPSGRSTP